MVPVPDARSIYPAVYPGVSGTPSPLLLGTIYPPENFVEFLDLQRGKVIDTTGNTAE